MNALDILLLALVVISGLLSLRLGLVREVFALGALLIGIFGAWLVCVQILGLDPGVFTENVKWIVDAKDVTQGLIKAVFFGFTVTLIACRHGFYAKGGAAGVGQATTSAVVQSAVSILVLDYLITSIITGQGGL